MRTPRLLSHVLALRPQRVLMCSAATLVVAGIAISQNGFGGSVVYTGGTVTENFDNLGTAGLDTGLLTGTGSLPNDGTSPWTIGIALVVGGVPQGGIAAHVTTTALNAVSTGATAVSATVRMFNNGEAGTNPITDRALGTGNTSGDPVIDLTIKNGSAQALSGFTLTWDTEWWRSGNAANLADTGYLLYVSTTGLANSWTNLNATTVSKTYTTAQSDLDGNAAANRVAGTSVSFAFGTAIATNGVFYLRWRDFNDLGTGQSPDANTAIDNVSFTGTLLGANLIYNLGHTAGGAPNGSLEVSAVPYFLNGATPSGFATGDIVAFSQDGSAVINVPANVAPTSVVVSNATGTYTIGGAGKITAALTKSGAGSLILTSANSFTAVGLSGGTITVQAAGALGTTPPLTVTAPGGTIQTDVDATVAGINGAGLFTKTGIGTLTVSGTGTGTGGIVIQTGKVTAATVAALGVTTQAVTLNGTTLEFTNSAADETFTDATNPRALDVGTTGGTISGTVGTAGTASIGLIFNRANSLTGSGPITKTGPSALRIAAVQSTLTSNWIINGGTLEYGAGQVNAIGSGTVTVNAGGRFAGKGIVGGTIVPNKVILNGGELSTRTTDDVNYSGEVNVAAASTAAMRSYSTQTSSVSFTISGLLTGGGDLSITGLNPQTNGFGKALILTNPGNTYTGTFRVAAAQILTSAPTSGGSTFNGTPIILSGSTLRIRDNGAGSNGTIVYGDRITIDTAASTIDIDRAAGGTSTGNNVRFGALVFGPQTLTVTSANGYAATFTGPVTLTGDGSLDGNADVTLSAAISGNAVGFSKSGSGRLTLDAVNTFSGTTLVTGGTISGNGSVAARLSVTAGAFEPGNAGAPGVFSIGADLDLGTGVLFGLNLAHGGGATPAAGTDYDQVRVGTGVGTTSTGLVSIGGSVLQLTIGTGVQVNDRFFVVINDGLDAVSGTFNGLADNSTFTVSGQDYQITYQADSTTGTLVGGNDIAIVALTAIPEPGSFPLALCATLGLLGWRRRRS